MNNEGCAVHLLNNCLMNNEYGRLRRETGGSASS